MGSLQRHDGVMGESWVDGNQITIQMESKIDVQDLIRLNAGEFFTVFQGMWCRQPLCIFRTARKVATVIRWSSTAIFPLKPPAGASPPSRPQDSAAQAPTPEHVSSIIGVLTAKPSRKRRKTVQSLTVSLIHSSASWQQRRHHWICFRNMIQISNPGQTNCGKRLCTLSITQPGKNAGYVISH